MKLDSKSLTTIVTPDLAVIASEEQLHELHALLEAAIEAAEAPLAKLREMSGPEMTGMAAECFTTLSMGAGYFRATRDKLNALWRKKRSRERQSITPIIL